VEKWWGCVEGQVKKIAELNGGEIAKVRRLLTTSIDPTLRQSGPTILDSVRHFCEEAVGYLWVSDGLTVYETFIFMDSALVSLFTKDECSALIPG
jgi:hypothetical protein